MCVPDVIGVLEVWIQKQKKKNSITVLPVNTVYVCKYFGQIKELNTDKRNLVHRVKIELTYGSEPKFFFFLSYPSIPGPGTPFPPPRYYRLASLPRANTRNVVRAPPPKLKQIPLIASSLLVSIRGPGPLSFFLSFLGGEYPITRV